MERIIKWFFRIISILMIIIAVVAIGAALINTFQEQGIVGPLLYLVLLVVRIFLVVGLSVAICWAWEK